MIFNRLSVPKPYIKLPMYGASIYVPTASSYYFHKDFSDIHFIINIPHVKLQVSHNYPQFLTVYNYNCI